MGPWRRGSLGVSTGERQPQGTAFSRPAGPGPRLTPPPLRKLLLPCSLPLRCVTVCASGSVSDPMPSSLPCLSPVCRLSVTRPLSLCPCVCVCVCARARARQRVCLSVAPSRCLPVCLGTFISFCLCLSRQPAARPFLWPRPLTGAMALAEELAPAGCLPSRGCVRVSGRLSVCLPVARGGFGHPAGAGQDGRSGPRLGCA